MGNPTNPAGPLRPPGPHAVERPFDVSEPAGVAPPSAAGPSDHYVTLAPASPPAPSATHWLQQGELEQRIGIVKSLFKTERLRGVLLVVTGVSLERLLQFLQRDPIEFYKTMRQYFRWATYGISTADDVAIEDIQDRPLKNTSVTLASIIAGGLIVTIDKSPWLAQGLALVDIAFDRQYSTAKTGLSRLDNNRFLRALRIGLDEIDGWILTLRRDDSPESRREVYGILRRELTVVEKKLEFITELLLDSSKIFSSRTLGDVSTLYWGLRAIRHYLSNKFMPIIGFYDLTKSVPAKTNDYLSKIIGFAKDYVSINDTNPFTFLPDIVDGLGGWRLTAEAKDYFENHVPAWLYPLVENMIQNAIREQHKKEGDFEGVIGMVSATTIPSSAPEAVREALSDWRILFVKDNGNGIPEEIRPKIFHQKVHADTTVPGNGEGLLDSFQFLTRKGGHIWFDTEVGVGATFYVALPVDGSAVPQAIDPTDEGGGGGEPSGDPNDMAAAEQAMQNDGLGVYGLPAGTAFSPVRSPAIR